MPKYRVTYVDSTLREALVTANSAEHAEEIAREEFENAMHHHTLDAWQDDWNAAKLSANSNQRPRCFECGE